MCSSDLGSYANSAFIKANAAYNAANSIVSVDTANIANVANALTITNPNTGVFYVKFGSNNSGQSQVSANAYFTFNAATDTLNVPNISNVNIVSANSFVTTGSGGNITGANNVYGNVLIANNGVTIAGTNVLPYLQSAFGAANAAFTQANSAYGSQNTTGS